MDSFVGLVLLSTLACSLATISVDLRVIPSVVDPTRTKNVTLICTASQYQYAEEEEISSLRIFKNYESGWKIVAELTDLEPGKVNVKEQSIASQTGRIARDGNVVGRMTISWFPASSSTLGQYKCLASRYTTDQNQIYTVFTTIKLGSQLDALAILRVMKSDKDEVTEKLEELTAKTERYQQSLKTSTDEDLSGLKDEVKNMETDLNATLVHQDAMFVQLKEQMLGLLEKSTKEQSARLEELDRKVQQALGRGFLLLWPSGTYALPATKSGCPAGAGVIWELGWRKQHTESVDRNKDEVSEGNHFSHPVRSIDSNQNNFVYQRFCIKTDRVSPGPTWPSGTYCIGKRGACPAFFEEGSITWDEQRSDGLSSIGGLLPDGQYFGSNTTVTYCCREDGPADELINLPRSQPFYLYRYGGQCQQVAGMNVRDEFIRFDTQNTNNGDAATGSHPDVTLNDVVLQLCYYQQVSV